MHNINSLCRFQYFVTNVTIVKSLNQALAKQSIAEDIMLDAQMNLTQIERDVGTVEYCFTFFQRACNVMCGKLMGTASDQSGGV